MKIQKTKNSRRFISTQNVSRCENFLKRNAQNAQKTVPISSSDSFHSNLNSKKSRFAGYSKGSSVNKISYHYYRWYVMIKRRYCYTENRMTTHPKAVSVHSLLEVIAFLQRGFFNLPVFFSKFVFRVLTTKFTTKTTA